MTYANEIRRKLIHLAASAFPVLYIFVSQTVMLVVVGVLLAILLALDLARLRSQRLNALSDRLMGNVLRTGESRNLTGATWMAIAGMICVLAFDRWVAIAAFLFISVSDALAALIGRRWGRTRIGGKSLEGSAAFFVSAVIIALVCLRHAPLAAVASAAAGTIAEAVPIRIGRFQFDDNLAIALISGAVMTVLLWSNGLAPIRG